MPPSQPISPRARRLARQLGIEFAALTPQQAGQRIVERDVLAALDRGNSAANLPWARTHEPPPGDRPWNWHQRYRFAAAAEANAPTGVLQTQIDGRPLRALCARRNAELLPHQLPTRYVDGLLWAAARALQRYPELNLRWNAGTLRQLSTADVAIAVDAPPGMLSPVVAEIESLTLDQLVVHTRTLGLLARKGRITPPMLEGGGLALVALGGHQVDQYTPRLEWGRTLALGIGQVTTELTLEDDQVVAREVFSTTLAFDQRAMDPAMAAGFLGEFRLQLEEFPEFANPEFANPEFADKE